jgi:ribosomal protein S18 acetylase RimI-like enzyme
MRYACLHDKTQIHQYLESDPYLHIYGLGDLDDFFWPRTTWYGLLGSSASDKPHAIALVYAGPDLPTVLGLSRNMEAMQMLIESIAHLLPHRFYAHFSPGVELALSKTHDVEFAADHLKMKLIEPEKVWLVETGDVVELGPSHAAEMEALYTDAYPGNWFDERMLETGQYRGLRRDGQLASIAGVHVYSPAYKVAALGNIVTRREYRGRGLATAVTAAVCIGLIRESLRIGLNVQADNAAAIEAYKNLGFEVAANYREFVICHKQAVH